MLSRKDWVFRKMFSRPFANHVEVEINGETIGIASSQYGVIIPTLESFYEYLSKSIFDRNSFNLYFRNDVYDFGIIQIGNELYSWDNNNIEEQIEQPEIITFDDPYFFVKNLADRVIENIEDNWDEWMMFESEFDENNPDYEYYKEVENTTAELIENIRNLKPQRMPELGNLLWGHSYGEYPIEDREKFQEKFQELLNMGFDSYGHIDDDKLEKYEQIKESNLTNRDIYPEDSKPVKEYPNYKPHLHYFDNGVFMMNPYYWGDAEDLMDFPNFIYNGATAEENVEIRWYKWPFRDSWSNMNLSYEDFCKIVDKCKDSLKGEIHATI